MMETTFVPISRRKSKLLLNNKNWSSSSRKQQRRTESNSFVFHESSPSLNSRGLSDFNTDGDTVCDGDEQDQQQPLNASSSSSSSNAPQSTRPQRDNVSTEDFFKSQIIEHLDETDPILIKYARFDIASVVMNKIEYNRLFKRAYPPDFSHAFVLQQPQSKQEKHHNKQFLRKQEACEKMKKCFIEIGLNGDDEDKIMTMLSDIIPSELITLPVQKTTQHATFTNENDEIEQRVFQKGIRSTLDLYLEDTTEAHILTFDCCQNSDHVFVGEWSNLYKCPICNASRFSTNFKGTPSPKITNALDSYAVKKELELLRPVRIINYRPIANIIHKLVQSSLFKRLIKYGYSPNFTKKYQFDKKSGKDTDEQFQDIFFSPHAKKHLVEMEAIYMSKKATLLKPFEEETSILGIKSACTIEPINLLIADYYDGAQPFKSKIGNFWPLVISILNLPPSIRSKPGKGMFTLSIFAGNGKDNEQFILKKCYAEELQSFAEGIMFKDELDKTKRYFVQIRVILHGYDTKGLEYILNVQASNALAGCPLCRSVNGLWKKETGHVCVCGHRGLLPWDHLTRNRGQSQQCCKNGFHGTSSFDKMRINEFFRFDEAMEYREQKSTLKTKMDSVDDDAVENDDDYDDDDENDDDGDDDDDGKHDNDDYFFHESDDEPQITSTRPSAKSKKTIAFLKTISTKDTLVTDLERRSATASAQSMSNKNVLAKFKKSVEKIEPLRIELSNIESLIPCECEVGASIDKTNLKELLRSGYRGEVEFQWYHEEFDFLAFQWFLYYPHADYRYPKKYERIGNVTYFHDYLHLCRQNKAIKDKKYGRKRAFEEHFRGVKGLWPFWVLHYANLKLDVCFDPFHSLMGLLKKLIAVLSRERGTSSKIVQACRNWAIHPSLYDNGKNSIPIWGLDKITMEIIDMWLCAMILPRGLSADFGGIKNIFQHSKKLRGVDAIHTLCAYMDLICLCIFMYEDLYPFAYLYFIMMLSRDVVEITNPVIDTSAPNIDRLYLRVAETLSIQEGIFPPPVNLQ
jgi:hypothetical protein